MTSDRPELSQHLDAETFRSYYYLKEELVRFCKEQQISASGGKQELTERIAQYLETGECADTPAQRKRSAFSDEITEDTLIESNFVCSERHRAFFREKIGKGFSFNVMFQKWLKNHAGKTYREGIEAYYQILEEKKKAPTTIDKQFEYNTYIRDFFADNKGRSLEDAIRCWNYKKNQKGHHRYERQDLIALGND